MWLNHTMINSCSDNMAFIGSPFPPDNPTIGTGRVKIYESGLVEVKLKVENESNQTYRVEIHHGPTMNRMAYTLGTVTTNNRGRGKALFDLHVLGAPQVIMPGFVLFKPNPTPPPDELIALHNAILISPPPP